jgi:hypothetical protein
LTRRIVGSIESRTRTLPAACSHAAPDKEPQMEHLGGEQMVKSKKSIARKVKSRTSAKKAAPRKAKRGYDIHAGKKPAAKSQPCTAYKY